MVQNVVNYVVIIYVENPDLKLLPGLTANISIHVQDHDSILKVPANSINFNPPADFIEKMTNIPDSIKTRLLKKMNAQASSENADAPVKQHKSAYIWVKKGEELFPEKVKIGLSDGNFTEVSGDIKEGDEVVTGQGGSNASSANQAAKSPFMPQMPGGRGR
jgi:HlyD family secretion protein